MQLMIIYVLEYYVRHESRVIICPGNTRNILIRLCYFFHLVNNIKWTILLLNTIVLSEFSWKSTVNC